MQKMSPGRGWTTGPSPLSPCDPIPTDANAMSEKHFKFLRRNEVIIITSDNVLIGLFRLIGSPGIITPDGHHLLTRAPAEPDLSFKAKSNVNLRKICPHCSNVADAYFDNALTSS